MNRQTIAERVRAQVKKYAEANSSDFTFIYQNMGGRKPDDGSPFIRVGVNFNGRQQVSFGGTTNRFRNEGTLVMQIMTPFEQGDAAAMTFADQTAPAFQSRTEDEVVWRTPDTFTAGRAGKWWQTNFVCPFYFDEIE